MLLHSGCLFVHEPGSALFRNPRPLIQQKAKAPSGAGFYRNYRLAKSLKPQRRGVICCVLDCLIPETANSEDCTEGSAAKQFFHVGQRLSYIPELLPFEKEHNRAIRRCTCNRSLESGCGCRP